jgi:sporadic carbohydrate cluster protein (TIGR04323 family)
MKTLRGYIFSRPILLDTVPQKNQNLIIRDYCSAYGYDYLLSAAEFCFEDSYIVLNGLLKNDLHNFDGIVMYSLFQLPKSVEYRQFIYSQLFINKKSLHFATERMSLNCHLEADQIELILNVNFIISNMVQKEKSWEI